MSARERKRAPHYAGAKHTYKTLRNRKERAKLRQALGNIAREVPGVDIPGEHIAEHAGPTRELEPFDHWAYD